MAPTEVNDGNPEEKMKEDANQSDSVPFAWSRRKTVTISSVELVETGLLDPGRHLPLVVRPRSNRVALIEWAKANRPLIASELLRYGAILFRGFPVGRPEEFRQLVEAISGHALPYNERSSPRSRVVENIYTSTDYPSDQSILPHNENSYAITFPRKLYFWCETAPSQGGETPLGDTRKILTRIVPPILKKFAETGWMYVRNFNPHFGLSWQTSFQTNDRRRVEEYCRKAAIEWEWTADGLRTRQTRPALTRHPESNELLWFNHAAFFHLSSVEPALRERLLREYDERDLPNQTYYGDGSRIEDEVAQHLREAYAGEMLSFPWEPGDVVVIDNMLTAHARAPFVGTRRILVAMAETYTRADAVGAPSEGN
jgi:alpha-ketoglutarate-dependent taurine dioxygenase